MIPEDMGDNLPLVEVGSGFAVKGMGIGCGNHQCVYGTVNGEYDVKCWGDGMFSICLFIHR